jgi:N-acyl-L-homoserine lactone synthetase
MKVIASRSAGRRPGFLTEIDSIEYSIALDPSEIDSIFKCRYKVLVSTEGYFEKNASERISDKFDQAATCTLIQARSDGRLIGTVRLILNGGDGLPSERYFDVRKTLPDVAPNRIADLNRIAVDSDFRKKDVGCNLMKIGHSLGIAEGVTHFVGIANPRAMNFFVNKLGWYQVGEQEFDEMHSVHYIPIVGEATLVPKVGLETVLRPTELKSVPSTEDPTSISPEI